MARFESVDLVGSNYLSGLPKSAGTEGPVLAFRAVADSASKAVEEQTRYLSVQMVAHLPSEAFAIRVVKLGVNVVLAATLRVKPTAA